MAVGYGAKTYKPGLLLACKLLRRFIVTWKTKLEQNLSPTLYATLLIVLDGVESVISGLEDPTSPDFIG